MCGISGAIRRTAGNRDPSPRPAGDRIVGLVERISDAQRHRGPDGSGLWQSTGGEVVFGHRRLAIIDLSEAGAQPMVDRDTGCAVTFNGEIYNFAAIRRELEALGERFRSSSDTEVILTAYKCWGIDAVRRFRGIFALALWDPRSRVTHLVRDPMGIKPLYWTAIRSESDGDVLLFASEVRALLACGAVPRRLDPSAVASYLWHGFVVGPGTIIEGVRLLPAATILTIAVDAESESESHQMRQFWQLPSSAGRPRTVADLRQELERTVEMQLIADVPLGVFLSGGVDSSAVAALASEVAPDAVHTFTIGFDQPAYDETRYARQVADAIGSRHKTVVLTEQSFEQQLPEAFSAIDQPTFDGINTYFVSRAAREAGMTVALAGTGGDELFGGYPSFVDLPRALRGGAWLPSARAGGVAGRAFGTAVTQGARMVNALAWNVLEVAPPQTRWGKIADMVRTASDLLGAYEVSYALFTRETQESMAGAAVKQAQRALQFGLAPHVAEAWRQGAAGSEVLHAISRLELSEFIGERLLRDTDAASMAVALEVRVPLLDHVLIETAAGIDPVRRFQPLGKKRLLRDAALTKLPADIFDRPKAGFVLPIDTWARQRMQPQMQELFEDQQQATRAGLRGEVVRTLWRSFAAGRPGLYWTRIWAIYVLLSWCQTHDVSIG
jgi:asparagine synthase (glutamine-hydrolysing)